MSSLLLPLFCVLLLTITYPLARRGDLTVNRLLLLYAETFLVLSVVADFVEPLLTVEIFSGLGYHLYWMATLPGLKWLALTYRRRRQATAQG
ncbi:hypothetical protein [Natronospira bacteriovora]|uniref:Lycopene cyclase domain-containing protein n=1 Tax=Natronospira bacteriovora TaxID=3069753 RepID=A0ABU0W6X4_9GAMM|nr:hypothetical protein [Natronospira sp. AB-CW4]MDQ2069783.1 hypothetical protein [Natronospira sp. AB-CW4]